MKWNREYLVQMTQMKILDLGRCLLVSSLKSEWSITQGSKLIFFQVASLVTKLQILVAREDVLVANNTEFLRLFCCLRCEKVLGINFLNGRQYINTNLRVYDVILCSRLTFRLL